MLEAFNQLDQKLVWIVFEQALRSSVRREGRERRAWRKPMHNMRLYDSTIRWSYTTISIKPAMEKAGVRSVKQDQGQSYGYSKLKGSIATEPTFNHTSIHTASAPMNSSLLGKLNFRKVVKQLEGEKVLASITKTDKANEGKANGNEGKRCVCALMTTVSESPSKALTNGDEKEFLRRKRISQANKGKVPWNKGGKHSAETRNRIRAGVTERMKDPKIREKLRLQAQAVRLSPEVKMKIKMGIIRSWVAKRQLKVRQELCLFEWEEWIAESARRGYEDDVEYQWNSYSVLRREGLRALTMRKRVPLGRPHHLSPQHRLHISAAIKAKWDNPDYRTNVEKGIRKSFSERFGTPRQAKPKVYPRETLLRSSKKPKTASNSQVTEGQVNLEYDGIITRKDYFDLDTQRRDLSSFNDINKHHDDKAVEKAAMMELDTTKMGSDVATYKDPEAEKKLQKLKSMRAQRMQVEAQKHKEITERARALIAQAQQAAKALEAAAVQDKNALAPLLETRKLLAEAVYSLESLNKRNSTSNAVIKEGDSALYAKVIGLTNVSSSQLLMVNNCWELGFTNVESSRLNT